MRVLVINCGSSSVKYEVVDTDGASLLEGKIERVPEDGYDGALTELLTVVRPLRPEAVGHRVVHGGERFRDAVLIDEDVLAGIEACVPLAPLHNPPNLAGIRAARLALPDLPHVAVFDTAFHATLPRRSRTYALPKALTEAHGLRRYGFHGPSHEFVARQAAAHLGRPLDSLRLVTCHLGSGASVCAVENGSSVATTMGMTPLEGLCMGTRSGDVDPGVLLHLLRAGLSVDELDRTLNRESGLKGLGGTNDLRDLQERAADGDEDARLAIGVFAHRVRKAVGAYAAVMGGVDAVVLAGGIGENSALMRRRILQRFDFLGLHLDEDANEAAKVGPERRCVRVSTATSRAHALVVATDEERMIAEQTARIASGARSVSLREPIPIAVSARHVHLNQETFELLFGAGAELTFRNALAQPGIFAAEETVTLHGPRRSIEGVRLLGPLRGQNQVEISRTDEFHLGVDAPVRRSGHVEGSAPITIEGPKGRITLEEGLICAWRHIHMRPEDAEAYGVEQGDFVNVRISGGVRDLTFSDVMIRVSPKFALEMHIDTDEANAAELARAGNGVLTAVVDADGVVLDKR